MILLAQFFVSSDFANWSDEDGQLHWIGQWHGLSSLYEPSTLGLAWFCLLLTVVLWFAIPARRQVIVWMLAMLIGALVVFSVVFASLLNVAGLDAVFGYTKHHAGRYLLPVLLAWFATLLTMFVRERTPRKSDPVPTIAVLLAGKAESETLGKYSGNPLLHCINHSPRGRARSVAGHCLTGRVSGETARPIFAHSCGVGYPEAEPPKQLRSMSVLMMPGLSGTAAMPGRQFLRQCLRQPFNRPFGGAIRRDFRGGERPQPELKFTMTPLLRLTIAGTKWRMTFAVTLQIHIHHVGKLLSRRPAKAAHCG